MDHYINSIFHIKNNLFIKPYIYNNLFHKYLEKNKIKSYSIITAFNSNIKDYNYNSKLNYFLEQDIKQYNYYFCYGADQLPNYTHKEDSFFIENISFEKAIELCKKYNQDCILYGTDAVPKLYNSNCTNLLEI